MTRKKVMEQLKEALSGLNCPVETRKDLERVPLAHEDLPCIVINDGSASKEEATAMAGGNGGVCKWRLKVGVLAVAKDEGLAAQILTDAAAAFAALEESEPDEISALELESHDFGIVQDEFRVAVASMQLEIVYLSGRWEV